ncbi:MAG: Holliday junction resolvase RuvX [Gammaproteobacteria bacterium]|nr:Holliday junction resolvase RuvX [Gammaproteobacteria bacterium]
MTAAATPRRPSRAGRILGLDYGLRRIGVAVGNPATATAQPLTAVAAFDGEPDWRALQKHLDAWRPAKLAVGLPLHMDGGESGISRRARAFGRNAAARFELPVVFVDERLTTRAAEELLQAEATATTATGRGRRMPGNLAARREKQRDCIAAQLIVQSYLDGCDGGDGGDGLDGRDGFDQSPSRAPNKTPPAAGADV